MACSGNSILGDPEAVSHVGINGTAKVFKNVRESPWDATVNKPVPRLIGMLVSDHVFSQSELRIYISLCFRDLLIRRSLPVNLQLKESFNYSRRVFQ